MNTDYKLDKIIKGTRVALLFSGGVDSTLLLKVLSDYCKTVGASITALTVENRAGYNFFCKSILNLSEFNHVIWKKDVFNYSRYDGNIDKAIGLVLADPSYDFIYTGTTKNPENILPGSPVRHTKEQIAKIPKLICPYADKTKDEVLKDYVTYDCYRLYKYTHSCTVSKIMACGECFQCLEKRWAENTVGGPYV